MTGKLWKDGFKMKSQYPNWIMTLFTKPESTLKGFRKIDFMDKIAAFCRFLPRDALKQAIFKYINQGIEEGNIETLILTGFGPRCHEVLQSYVDAYSDFQTPALIACHYIQYVKDKDPRVTKWISEYRKYLSKLRLWNIRADFDSHCYNADGQAQKYEHTIFCPNPMCEMNIAVAHNTPNPLKSDKYLTYCKCANPIICSVCHMPMNRINPLFKVGFPSHNSDKPIKKSRSEPQFNQMNNSSNTRDDIKLDFTEWFTWCQTCKHVGHLEHMEEWFSEHTGKFYTQIAFIALS